MSGPRPLPARIHDRGVAKPSQVVKFVQAALVSLDRELGEAAEAIEKGELELGDFAWEDEMEAGRDVGPTDDRQSD